MNGRAFHFVEISMNAGGKRGTFVVVVVKSIYPIMYAENIHFVLDLNFQKKNVSFDLRVINCALRV